MSEKIKIAVVGFGKLGQALANILEIKNDFTEVSAWDLIPTGDLRQKKSLEETIKEASIIFIAVPSKFFSDCILTLGDLKNENILVSFTKGFDGRTGLFPFEVLNNSYPNKVIGVVSGPMLSEELEAGLPTRASIASNNLEEINKVTELFNNTNLHLEKSEDLIGVSVLGILKNVYAIALGLSDGLGLGSNFKSCLTLLSLKEMELILIKSGGKRETLMTPSGIADFLTTGYCEKSRNYSFGLLKAKNEKTEGSLTEGVNNLEIVLKKASTFGKLPILNCIKRIIIDNENPSILLKEV